jgi:hypothetical protein
VLVTRICLEIGLNQFWDKNKHNAGEASLGNMIIAFVKSISNNNKNASIVPEYWELFNVLKEHINGKNTGNRLKEDRSVAQKENPVRDLRRAIGQVPP